jgi:hypothetical protein
MGQPVYFLLTGLDEKGRPHPEYERHLNNGLTPPRAGDILVAQGPFSGQFHTALFQSVRGSSVTVFQANVAWSGFHAFKHIQEAAVPSAVGGVAELRAAHACFTLHSCRVPLCAPWHSYRDWAAPGKFLYARLPLQFNLTTNRYYMPDLQTQSFGYRNAYPVVGWIHPTGAAASLPGAPA